MWKLNTVPELVGIELAALEIGRASQWTCSLARGGERIDPAHPDFVPCYFLGNLAGPQITEPVQLAIALNCTPRGTSHSSRSTARSRQCWSFLRCDV